MKGEKLYIWLVAIALAAMAGMAQAADTGLDRAALLKLADMTKQNLFDMPAMHIYKIWGGQMHEIEAIGIVAPYNSATGRE